VPPDCQRSAGSRPLNGIDRIDDAAEVVDGTSVVIGGRHRDAPVGAMFW
jgi:hypothetical protein